MYLKSLTLRGFKSFARPTTFKLEPGITAIVGPNGSGKSNVVDALAWVMGEQGAKSLRGASMSDIIFAGTAERSSLGRAQVELTIDNTDGRLPIDFSEVTISRTIFRGGGSEYAINRSPARLLDVQELLSDTGMGRQMHVIVGQGQLDAVLRATPDERRAFIDEAAGVLKHRRRKERALRKLESMDANLVRVVDLTDEIKRQLKPLARQAKAAAKAADVRERLDRCERALAAADLWQTFHDWKKLQEELERLSGGVADAQEYLEDQEKALQEAEAVWQRYRASTQAYSELAHEIGAVAERLRSLEMLANERMTKYPASVVSITEASIALAEEKATEAAHELVRARERLEQSQTQARRAQNEREEAESLEAELHKQVRNLSEAVEQDKARRARLEQGAAVASQKLESGVARLQELQTQFEVAMKDLEEARAQVREAQAMAPATEGDAAANHQALVEAEGRARAELSAAQEDERQAGEELSTWTARRDALGEQLPDPSEGAPANWDVVSYLAQNIAVTSGWENAVGALLWPFEEASVVSDQADIRAGIEVAKQNQDDLRAVYADLEVMAPILGVVKASDLVAGAVSRLLSGCAVATNIDEARALLSDSKNVGIERVATQDGVVLTRAGVVANLGGKDSLVLLQARWQEASEAAKAAEGRWQRERDRVKAAQSHLAEASRQSALALTKMREWDAQQAQQAQRQALAQSRLTQAEAALRRTQEELQAGEAAVAQAQEMLASAEEAAKEASQTGDDASLDELRDRLQQAIDKARALRAVEMDAKVSLNSTEEALRASVRQSDAFKARAEQLRESLSKQQLQEESNQRQREALQLQRNEAHRALERARLDYQEAQTALALHQVASDAAAEKVDEYRRGLEESRSRSSLASQMRQKTEVAAAGAEVKYLQALSAAWKYSPEGGAAPQVPPPELPEALMQLIDTSGLSLETAEAKSNWGTGTSSGFDKEALLRQRDEAAAELRKLGVVNPLAMEEYDALSERQSFLLDQVADLEKSKADLLAIVRDVDRRIRDSFTEAFAETEAQFRDVFGKLFPGGKGQLSLTDPDDPLHTGVEISARPAGKRITQMSLLSGGERSLAALAYLIAIFKARPSPFYIMDEVEAALDDINLSRVLGLFEELRADSQLLLVTHQKRTMEIADALYGVTMRGGTTAVMSHRLAKK